MVLMRVAFHENDRNHENNENDEDKSDSYIYKELSAGLAEITETTEMTKTIGIRGANHGLPKQQRGFRNSHSHDDLMRGSEPCLSGPPFTMHPICTPWIVMSLHTKLIRYCPPRFL